MTSTNSPNWDIRDAIVELGGDEAYKCFQCGTCMAVCPWTQVAGLAFPVYRIPQAVKLGVILASEDTAEIGREVTDVYRCVGCEACTARCPHGASQPIIMRAMRRILVEYESYPAELRDAVGRVQSAGNPFGEPREQRARWAADLDVEPFAAGMELVFSPCCVPAYDPRAKKVAAATVSLLRHAGVAFGQVGSAESCCGEAIRRVGAEEVFREVATRNLALFAELGASRVLVTSPHCLLAFGREYQDLDGHVEAVHHTQLLARLMDEERLQPLRPVDARVVYHDPCTLGRANDIYEEPRQLLAAIPGVDLVEVPHFSRQHSLCCGGGGGGMWLERGKGERLSDLRLRQLAATGADIVAVACPYCLQMFEDSVKTLDLNLVVKDVSELLAESVLGGDANNG